MCSCVCPDTQYGKLWSITDDQFEADEDEQSGMFRFRFTGAISPEAALLMNSLVLGLEDIEETYGEPYIKIRFEEV